jgi:hypothetical protein
MPMDLTKEALMYKGDTTNYVQSVGNTVIQFDPSRAFPGRTYSHVGRVGLTCELSKAPRPCSGLSRLTHWFKHARPT